MKRGRLLLLALSLLLGTQGCDDDGVDEPDCDDGAGPGRIEIVQEMDFVRLCPGTFEMGCTASQEAADHCDDDERPAHSVTLTRGGWISRTEVTQGQWQALMGNNPSLFSFCGSDCPVESVNWWEAVAFANAVSAAEGLAECYTLSGCSGTAGVDLECNFLGVESASGSQYPCEGYRLPYEAEWEYAGRAGTDLLFAGSDTLEDVGWHIDNSGGTTNPVASLDPNDWGLYDMTGNLWEWVWDRHDPDYYAISSGVDPEGSNVGSGRILRGGGWLHGHGSDLRISNRTSSSRIGQGGPVGREPWVGFRLWRTSP